MPSLKYDLEHLGYPLLMNSREGEGEIFALIVKKN
jgi:hypothetical protein